MSGVLAIDRTDDRMAGPLVLSVLVHLAAAGLLLLVSVSCDWCALVPSGLRPLLCPTRCRKVKTIRVTPAYTISLVSMPPRGRLTAGGRAKKPIKKAAKPSLLKPGRTTPAPAARPRPRPVKKTAAAPRPEPTLPPLPAVAIAPPTRPRVEKLPSRKKAQPIKKAPSLTAVISRLAEAKPSPEALARRKAILKAKARARERARKLAEARVRALEQARKLAAARAKKLAEARARAKKLAADRAAAQARAKKLAAARAKAQARARALERKLARLKKRKARRSGPRHLTAAQKIARLEKRSRAGFGPGGDPGNYGLPSGRPGGGGGTPESYYATLVEQRVVSTLRRYGRWTRRKVHVTLLVRVARTGRLMWARVYKSSGDPTYDDRVLGAVQGIRQFLPFPPGIKKRWLEFEITIHSSAISGQA